MIESPLELILRHLRESGGVGPDPTINQAVRAVAADAAKWQAHEQEREAAKPPKAGA